MTQSCNILTNQCHFLHIWYRHPHVTHCSLGQAQYHAKRHLCRFSRFCMGPNAMLCNALSMWKKTP